MQDIILFSVKIIILTTSYFLSNFIAKKIKIKVVRYLYNHSKDFESRVFVFKLLLKLIAPTIFMILASSISFILQHLSHEIAKESPFFPIIPLEHTVATISLAVKMGLIWIIYRIANLSSINNTINKIFSIILLTSSFINFFGIDGFLNHFFGKFKANFGSFEVSIYKAFLLVIILGGVFWFNKVLLESFKKILDITQINTNVKTLLVKFFSILLFILIFLSGLSFLGVDLKSLAIFGSALAVGLGFGFQKLVSNVISGITISFEEIIKEGDIILLDDKREIRGIIKSLNMRYILVQEFDGKEVMIPNDVIATSNIANLTHTNNYLRIRLDFTLHKNINLNVFRADIMNIMNSNPYASNVEESVFHIDSINEIGINIFLFFWIRNPFDLNVARTDLLFSILNYMKEHNIEIPTPISTVNLWSKN
jgi:small-conductance mechanosensitive channel